MVENDGYYKHELVKFFDSATHAAFEAIVKEHRNKVVTLFTSSPYQISAGDKYSILSGCGKTFLTCKNKFHSIVNFRGEPYVPGFELAQQRNFQYYK